MLTSDKTVKFQNRQLAYSLISTQQLFHPKQHKIQKVSNYVMLITDNTSSVHKKQKPRTATHSRDTTECCWC